MKKILLVLFFLAVFCSPIKAEAQARILFNGKTLTTGALPIMRSGQILLPLRATFEALGITVLWNRELGRVEGEGQGRKLILTPNISSAQIDGRPVALDVPPAISNGRVFVPLRFVAEEMGKRVVWDSLERVVTIESVNKPIVLALSQQNNGEQTRIINRHGIEVEEPPHTASGILYLRGNTSGKTGIMVERVAGGERGQAEVLTMEAGTFNRRVFLTEGIGEYRIRLLVWEEGFRFLVAHTLPVTNQKEINRFLVPGRGIESNHPDIIRMAERITRGLTTDEARIRAVYDWVRKNVSYSDAKATSLKNFYFGFPTGALYALQNRAGVCEEFATLSAALLRAVGIQAKVVTGMANGGLHAWNRAFNGSRWIEFDATFAATGKRDFFNRDLSRTHNKQTTR